MHNNSLALFAKFGLEYIHEGMDVLEIGPDWSTVGGRCRPLIEERDANYHFADIKNPPGCIYMAHEYGILVDDGQFDVVFALNVAEHVRNLWRWVIELRRVAKQGGYLIFVNPISWAYHPSPYDCWRIYPEGWKALFDSCYIEHVYSFFGSLESLELDCQPEHGPPPVVDCLAIGKVVETRYSLRRKKSWP